MLPILVTSQVSHLEENVAAATIEVDGKELTRFGSNGIERRERALFTMTSTWAWLQVGLTTFGTQIGP